jgi:GntR family transcriptional regulator/MocR family aminotransferase
MIPYKTILKLDKEKKQALYIQLTNQFIHLIKQGVLLPETRLPSSRQLAELIGVHRKTVVASYEELDM